MSEPIKQYEIYATISNGDLIGEGEPFKGVTLKSTDKMVNRQLKTAGDGTRLLLRIVDGDVVEVLKDSFRERVDGKRQEKQEDIEEFATQLAVKKVIAKIGAKTTRHGLSDGTPRLDNFYAVLESGEFTIVSASASQFQMKITMSGPSKDWAVTGYWEVVDGKINITITHFGPGSLY